MRYYRHPKTDIIYIDFTIDGKRKRKSTKLKYTPSNIKIVEKTLIPQMEVAIATGTFKLEDTTNLNTLEKYAEIFFDSYRYSVSTNVYKATRYSYEKHIKNYFKDKLVKDIKPIDIEKWQSLLISNYSLATVRMYRTKLKMILDKAVLDEVIDSNPVLKVKHLTKNRDDYEAEYTKNVNAFTKEDIASLVDISDGYIKNVIQFLYATGMRPSEMVALLWSDIDFENKTISINKAAKPQGIVGNTKNESSVRVIDMLPLAEKILRSQKDLTNKYNQSNIFLNSKNERFRDYTTISKTFLNISRKLKLNGTLYNLRHTFASVMISSGAELLWVSKTLGHANLKTTLSVYAKFIKLDENIRLNNIKKYGTYLTHQDFQ